MPVKIRLMRIGARKRPFYRVVAVDERKKPSGDYLDLLGTYNPLTNPHEIKLDQGKIDSWVKKGAVLSDGFLRIIGKAPQKPPRKPKKEKKSKPTQAAQPAQEQKAEEQVPSPKHVPAEGAQSKEPAQLEEQASEKSEERKEDAAAESSKVPAEQEAATESPAAKEEEQSKEVSEPEKNEETRKNP